MERRSEPRRCGVALVIVGAAWLAFPDVGAAQDEASSDAPQDTASRDSEARALFTAGQTAFEAGRYEAALGHFRAAHELSGRPELLYNIGLAADRLRHDQEALDAFTAFLDQVPDSPLRDQVEARAAILRQAIAQRISPEEVAAAQARGEELGAQRVRTQEPHAGVAHKWWFWTALGVVVAGAAVGVVLATRGGTEDPALGNTGVIIRALGER